MYIHMNYTNCLYNHRLIVSGITGTEFSLLIRSVIAVGFSVTYESVGNASSSGLALEYMGLQVFPATACTEMKKL